MTTRLSQLAFLLSFIIIHLLFSNISDSEAVSADRRLPTGYIQYECLFNDVEVRHGSVLKTNIHCVNNVELSSSMMADPLTVSFNQPSTPSARVEIIPKSKGLINNADFSGDDTVVQDNLTCIHAQWFGFEDITGVSHYRLTLKNNESAILTSMNTTSSRNTVELHGLRLRDGQVYMVEVQAINNGGVYSDPVSASVRTDSRQPKLTGKFISGLPRNENYLFTHLSSFCWCLCYILRSQAVFCSLSLLFSLRKVSALNDHS